MTKVGPLFATAKGEFTSENHRAARAYAARGIRIFPCNTEKRPLVSDWLNAASADESAIDEWWTQTPEALIGLPMKAINCLVIDCDRHLLDEDGVAGFKQMIAEHGPLPEHPIIETPNNGQHHYFQQPPDRKIGNRKIVPGIETRGYKPDNDGGYVIGTGSVLPNGKRWRVTANSPAILAAIEDATLPQCPAWLLEKLDAPGKSSVNVDAPHPAGKREASYAEAALRNASDKVAITKRGNRNNELNAAAFSLGTMVARGWIGRSTVEGRLYDSAIACDLVQDDGPNAIRGTIRSGLDAGMKNPHTDLEARPRNETAEDAGKAEPIHDWTDPDWSILDDRRGLPDFPIEIFSEEIQTLIKRTAKGAGVTDAHVAVPLLGITSSLTGISRRIKVNSSWLQPVTGDCWFLWHRQDPRHQCDQAGAQGS